MKSKCIKCKKYSSFIHLLGLCKLGEFIYSKHFNNIYIYILQGLKHIMKYFNMQMFFKYF